MGAKGYGGYVVQVANGEVVMGAHPLTITASRFKLLDVTAVQAYSEMIWASRLPKPRSNSHFKIVKVFDWQVWATILLTAVLIILTLGCPSESSYFMAGTLAMTSLISEPVATKWMNAFIKKRPQLIILATWIPMAFIVNMFYRANLLVNILAIDYEKPIDRSVQVLEQKLPVWTYGSGIFYNIFTQNPTQDMQKIYENNILQLGGTFEATAEVAIPRNVQALRDSGLSVWPDLKIYLKKTHHIYYQGKEILKQGYRTYPLQMTSPLGEKISILMLRYNECKLDHFPEEKELGWKADLKPQMPKVSEEETSLNLNQIMSSLYLLLCGLIISMFVFALESFGAKYRFLPGEVDYT